MLTKAPPALRPSLFLVLAGLIILTAAALRFYDLGERSLSLDECIMREVAETPWAELPRVNIEIHSAPPLYPAIARIGTLLLPYSEFYHRLPACIFGILAVAVLALGMPRTLRSAGLAAAFLMAGAPMQLWLSRDDNGYSLLVLAVVLCVCLYFHLTEKNRKILWALAFCEILAVWSHYQGVFAIAGLQLAYLGERVLYNRPLPSVRQWIGAHLFALIGVAAVIPASLAGQLVTNPRGTTYLSSQYFHWRTDFFPEWLLRNAGDFLEMAFTPSHHGSIWLYGLIAWAAFLFLVFYIRRSGKKYTRTHSDAFMILLVAVGFFISNLLAALAGIYPFGGIRHVVFATVPFYMMTGFFLAAAFRRYSVFWMIAVALIWVPGIRDHYALNLYAGEHLRPLVHRLIQSDDTDPVYLYRSSIRAFSYYYRDTDRLFFLSEKPFGPERVRKDLECIPGRRFWSICSHLSPERIRILESVFSTPPYRITETRDEPGAKLWQVERMDQPPSNPNSAYIYKEIPPDRTPEWLPAKTRLSLYFFRPRIDVLSPSPAIVFFFGGGWVKGDPAQLFPLCRRLAEKGITAISADYRLAGKNGQTPAHSLRDARDAIRWLRAHARELHIRPDRIAAGGTSAGAHLAAGTALIPEAGRKIASGTITGESRPDALILLSAVLDTTETGYDGLEAFNLPPRSLSPVHHIRGDMPPTLILHGNADQVIPPETARRFVRLAQRAGNDARLHLFPDVGHGLFHERSEEVATEIVRFISDIWPSDMQEDPLVSP